ncbi:MAG: hypothetical protein COA38_17070 [Fluviicola sp.]|nr:MAG: hypothetical protein COA38_17070 [Fluviicola sp.]
MLLMNRKGRFALFLLAILTFQFNATGQSASTKTLKRQVSRTTSTQKKGELLNQISWLYFEERNDSSLLYANRALLHADKYDLKEQLIVANLQTAEINRLKKDFDLVLVHLNNAHSSIKKGSFPELNVQYILFKGNLAYSERDYEKALSLYKKGYQKSLKHNKKLQTEFCFKFAKIDVRNSAFDQAEKQYLKASALALKYSDSTREILAYNNLGNLFARQQRYEESMPYFEKSLQLSLSYKNLRGQSKAYLNIGNLYYFKGYWTTSIEHYVKSANIKNALNDQAGMAKIHNNIGAIYKEQKRFEKSINYYQKSADFYKDQADTIRLTETWVNISVAKIILGKAKEGVQLLKQVLLLLDAKEDSETRLAAEINLAFAYSEMGKHGRALKQLAIAEASAIDLKDPHTQVFIDNLYGASYFHLENYTKAIVYYQKSLRVARDLGLLNDQKKALFGLYEAEEKLGRFQQSLSRFKEYNTLKDSLYNVASTTKLNELQEKYDSEQKENEIVNLNARNHSIGIENELKTNELKSSRLTIGIIVLIVLLLSIFIYQRIKGHKTQLAHTKKINEEEIHNLIQEQEITTLETVVETQQNERKKLAKDLHDTLGSYLATLKYQHEASTPKSTDALVMANYQKTSELITSASTELRSISHQMATGEGVEFDLISATRELVNRIQSTQRFKVHFHSLMEDRIQNSIELTLYKIIQELFSNVLKHAEAQEVTLQINRDENEVTIMFEDDGKGFDVSKSQLKGIGLSNVTHRVDELQGKLEINSQQNQGTTILVIAPLNQQL